MNDSKGSYIPSECVKQCDLFRSEIVSVRSNPLGFPVHAIAKQTDGLLRLVGTRPAEWDNGIVKNDVFPRDFIFLYTNLVRFGFNPASKMLAFTRLEGNICMALISTIHDAGLPRLKHLSGNGTIEVNPDRGFCLLALFSIIGPMHR